MRQILKLPALGLIALLVLGCGGGGGSTTVARTATPSVAITWGARARDVEGPGSALSAMITFQGAGLGGANVSFSVDRATSPSGYTQSYKGPASIATGVHVLQVAFCANADGQGGVVATASASVDVDSQGALHNPDGSPLGSILAVGNINIVSIVGTETASIGVPYDVEVSARDSVGDQIAITSGSASIQVVSGPATVNASQQLVFSSAGTADVIATVDGVASEFGVIYCSPPTAVIRTLTLSANGLVLNPVSGNLWASVAETAPQYANSVVEISPGSGTILGAVALSNDPGPVAISGDGSTLFVGLLDSSQVCPVTTASRTAGIPFSIGAGNVAEIAVQPGSTSVIAVTISSLPSGQDQGPEIISNGTILPNALGIYQGQALAFVSASQLYAFNDATSTFDLYNCAVNSSGVTIVSDTSNVLTGSYQSTIQAAGGRIYCSNGSVMSAASNTRLGQFSLNAVGSDAQCVAFTVDAANKRAFFVMDSFGTSPLTIEVFDTGTFLQVATADYPSSVTVGLQPCLTRFGAKGLALSGQTALYFIDNAPGL